jgi:hypothetical protein
MMPEKWNIDHLKEHIPLVAPYLVTLYYFEIIFIMPVMYFVVGKAGAVLTGLTLAILLTLQVLALYFKKEINRRIQLIITDIHFAYVLATLVNFGMHDFDGHTIDIAMYGIRFITILADIPLIWFLTDEKVKLDYSA